MNLLNTIKIAFKALLRNKTRALLTMLGIIIGISSVIAMVALGESSTANITAEISSTGTNMVFITPVAQNKGGVNMGASSNESLTLEDVDALRKQSQYLSNISPSVSATGQLINGTYNWLGSVQGVDASFFNIRKIELDKGVLFSANDVATAAKVCIIGQTIVEELFPNESAVIGKNIRFKGIPLRVIGIQEQKGQNQMGQDQDNVVYLPYTTVQKRMLGIVHVQSIFASAISEDKSEAAVDEIKMILRSQHKLKPSDELDFEIRTQAEMLKMVSSVTGMLTLLLAAIAAISLIVGGIGIMNIMYVTVTERTKEIGLRMSIGAQNRDILLQFLTESIILSLIGGVIGILCGITLAYAGTNLLGWPYMINMTSIWASFGVCAATGVFFGWYPARKASQLDPIVALRYE